MGISIGGGGIQAGGARLHHQRLRGLGVVGDQHLRELANVRVLRLLQRDLRRLDLEQVAGPGLHGIGHRHGRRHVAHHRRRAGASRHGRGHVAVVHVAGAAGEREGGGGEE
jgi:hypothetical protein